MELKLEPDKRNKLTNEQVLIIRKELSTGELSQRELAKKYRVSYSTINSIAKNKTYKSTELDDEGYPIYCPDITAGILKNKVKDHESRIISLEEEKISLEQRVTALEQEVKYLRELLRSNGIVANIATVNDDRPGLESYTKSKKISFKDSKESSLPVDQWTAADFVYYYAEEYRRHHKNTCPFMDQKTFNRHIEEVNTIIKDNTLSKKNLKGYIYWAVNICKKENNTNFIFKGILIDDYTKSNHYGICPMSQKEKNIRQEEQKANTIIPKLKKSLDEALDEIDV